MLCFCFTFFSLSTHCCHAFDVIFSFVIIIIIIIIIIMSLEKVTFMFCGFSSHCDVTTLCLELASS